MKHLEEKLCRERTARLCSLLSEKRIEVAVISHPKDIYYLSGFLRIPYSWVGLRTELLVCFASGDYFLFCSNTAAPMAKEAGVNHVVTYTDYDIHVSTEMYLEQALVPFKEKLRQDSGRISRVGIEKRYAPSAVAEALGEVYGNAEFVDISTDILRMRERKHEDEIRLIREAARLSDLCYTEALSHMHAGESEISVYAACSAAYLKAIPGYGIAAGDFVAGKRTLKLDGPGEPTPYVLKPGDPMIIDLQIEPYGYWADSARCYVVGGEPSSEQKNLLSLVTGALEYTEQFLKPAMKAQDVYHELYGFFEQKGMAKHFPHHAGHGIGLSPHESPLFIPVSDDVLEPGMVCTLEPGLYIPDLCGFRCEDIFVITDQGCERLTRFPRTGGWAV